MTDIQKLPASQLQPNPFQPREKVKKEDLMDLIESIRIHGILEPLVVAETPAAIKLLREKDGGGQPKYWVLKRCQFT